MNLLQKTSFWLSSGVWPGRQDRDNFTTNRRTLQADDDSRSSISGNELGLAAVWACVNLLAGTISSLPIMVYRTDRNGKRSVASDHSLYRVLHDSPNADQTAVDFWDGACASIELKGNAVIDVERASDGRVISLTPIAWDGLSVRRDRAGSLVYRWGGEVRRQDQVLHIRGFGGAPEGGMSTLAYGRRVFGLANAIDNAASTTFANGVRPSGVLTTKDWMKAEQREVYRQALEEKFVGSMNAGRPMVLEGGTTWQQLTINPEDAQMLESRGFSIEETARFFGVPPIMIGHGEKTSSWGTGIQEVTLGFVKYTLRRRVKRIEQAIQKQLLTPADRAQGLSVEFNLEGLLRGDSVARSAFYATMLQNGVMTINEVRALENLPAVEGGDVPRMQMQNVPITQAGQASVPPLV